MATHEYAAIARDVRAATSWRERAGRVFRGPGWQPEPAAAPTAVTAPAAASAPASSAPTAAPASAEPAA